MATQHSRLDDRWMWVGIGAFLFIATKGIAHGLARTYELGVPSDRHETADKLPPPSPNDGLLSVSASNPPSKPQRPEDSISQSALATLSSSPNPEISFAATSVLAARFLTRTTEHSAWIDALFSPEDGTRKQAARLYTFLFSSGGDAYAADAPSSPAVKELRRLRPLVGAALGSDPDVARTVRSVYGFVRDSGDERLRTLLFNLAKAMELLDDAGVILLPDMNARQAKPWLDAMHHRLWMDLMNNSNVRFVRALERMHAAGEGGADGVVNGKDDADAEEDMYDDPLIHVLGDRLLDGTSDGLLDDDLDYELGPLRWSDPPRQSRLRARFREASFEEDEVRRRRREAMVFHEGDGSVDRDDIIQRDM